MGDRQMLSAQVPSGTHDLDSIKCAAAFPRVHGRVSGPAGETIFNRYHPGAPQVAPSGVERWADMSKQRDVDILQQSVANVEGLGAQKLLRHAGEDNELAAQVMLFHNGLQGLRGSTDHAHSRIMALAMAGRAPPKGTQRGRARQDRKKRG